MEEPNLNRLDFNSQLMESIDSSSQLFLFKQVRRSFLEELGIHNNWTVVEMIFREFYTGSDKDLSPEERRILQSLFTTQSYVKREIEYSYTSTVGSVNVSALEGWSNYLEKYREYIVSGTHFTNFAVQVTFKTTMASLMSRQS